MAASVRAGFVCCSLIIVVYLCHTTFQVTAAPLSVNNVHSNNVARNLRTDRHAKLVNQAQGAVHDRQRHKRRFYKPAPHQVAEKHLEPRFSDKYYNTARRRPDWQDQGSAGQRGYYKGNGPPLKVPYYGRTYDRSPQGEPPAASWGQGGRPYHWYDGHTDSRYAEFGKWSQPDAQSGKGNNEMSVNRAKYLGKLPSGYKESIKAVPKPGLTETGIYDTEQVGVPKKVAGFWKDTPERDSGETKAEKSILESITKNERRLRPQKLRGSYRSRTLGAQYDVRQEDPRSYSKQESNEWYPLKQQDEYPTQYDRPGFDTGNQLPNAQYPGNFDRRSQQQAPERSLVNRSPFGNFDTRERNHPVDGMLLNLRREPPHSVMVAHHLDRVSVADNNGVQETLVTDPTNGTLQQNASAIQLPLAYITDSARTPKPIEQLDIPMPPKSKDWVLNHPEVMTTRQLTPTASTLKRTTPEPTTTEPGIPMPPKSKLWLIEQERLQKEEEEIREEEKAIDTLDGISKELSGNESLDQVVKTQRVKLLKEEEIEKERAKILAEMEAVDAVGQGQLSRNESLDQVVKTQRVKLLKEEEIEKERAKMLTEMEAVEAAGQGQLSGNESLDQVVKTQRVKLLKEEEIEKERAKMLAEMEAVEAVGQGVKPLKEEWIEKEWAKMLPEMEAVEAASRVESDVVRTNATEQGNVRHAEVYAPPYMEHAPMEGGDSGKQAFSQAQQAAEMQQQNHQHSGESNGMETEDSVETGNGSENINELAKIWQELHSARSRVKRSLYERWQDRSGDRVTRQGVMQDELDQGKNLVKNVKGIGDVASGKRVPAVEETGGRTKDLMVNGNKIPMPAIRGNAVVKNADRHVAAFPMHEVHTDRIGVPKKAAGYWVDTPSGEGDKGDKPRSSRYMKVVLNKNSMASHKSKDILPAHSPGASRLPEAAHVTDRNRRPIGSESRFSESINSSPLLDSGRVPKLPAPGPPRVPFHGKLAPADQAMLPAHQARVVRPAPRMNHQEVAQRAQHVPSAQRKQPQPAPAQFLTREVRLRQIVTPQNIQLSKMAGLGYQGREAIVPQQLPRTVLAAQQKSGPQPKIPMVNNPLARRNHPLVPAGGHDQANPPFAYSAAVEGRVPNESLAYNDTDHQYELFDPAFYKDIMARYKSRDALWAALCLAAVLAVLFAAVWYSKMWRHRDGDWDLPSKYQPQSVSIPIKELIRQKLGRLPRTKVRLKRKRWGPLGHGYTQLKAKQKRVNAGSSSDDGEVTYKRL